MTWTLLVMMNLAMLSQTRRFRFPMPSREQNHTRYIRMSRWLFVSWHQRISAHGVTILVRHSGHSWLVAMMRSEQSFRQLELCESAYEHTWPNGYLVSFIMLVGINSPAIHHRQRRFLVLTDYTQTSIYLRHGSRRYTLHPRIWSRPFALNRRCKRLGSIADSVCFSFFFQSLSLEPFPLVTYQLVYTIDQFFPDHQTTSFV